MKKVFLFLLSLILLTGCSNTNNFTYEKNNIIRIELIYIEKNIYILEDINKFFKDRKEVNDLETFIEEFSQIEFSKYLIGDPNAVKGESIYVYYSDGLKEIITYNSGLYSTNEFPSGIYRYSYCDEQVFNNFYYKWVGIVIKNKNN